MTRRGAFLLAAALAIPPGCARPAGSAPAPLAAPLLAEQSSGTTALLQAVSAVSDQVAWVSGHRATWARTTDGGASWMPGHMTGGDSTLQFRDVHAVDATTAYLLAAGPGLASRIYKTTNGGASWDLQFMNRDTAAFFDCFDFWDSAHGIAVSDAVGGRLIVIGTDDGGAHWTDRSAGLPAAQDGEGAFAASGTCLVTRPGGHAWIAAEAGAGSRVYHSSDRGRSWSLAAVPVMAGPATGVASLAFADDRSGLAAGGSVGDANGRGDNVARTDDGGRTWVSAGRPTFSGAVFGVAHAGGTSAYIAAGPKGLDYSTDGGRSWTNLNANAYWSVGFSSSRTGWAVGPAGRITKIAM